MSKDNDAHDDDVEQEKESSQVSDTVIIAEGAVDDNGVSLKRKIKLTLPRGKYARGKTPAIIESISGFDMMQNDDGSVSVADLGVAMDSMFKTRNFVEDLFPLAMGILNPKTGKISKADTEWMNSLTDMDMFESYIQAAAFIANNGRMGKEAAAAVKK